jgi:serine/threonine protein kinase
MSFNQEVSLMEFFSDSKFVAKLIGYCKEPLCLIMKYYPAGSLDRWVADNKNLVTKPSVKVAIANDISKGLYELHGRLVAHSDLKPQNVLVEESHEGPNFVLTDFGISKILTNEYLASEAFQIRNLRGLTVSYAAPDSLKRFNDQRFGTPIEEKAADIYALGIIVSFLLLMGEPWGDYFGN